VGYSIRPCQRLDELAGCVSLQRRIWGYAEHEVYPLRLFVTLTKIGGHVLGAFSEGNELVGFVASMPAWHGRRRYYHSLSLGVLGAHENRGLGRSLKLAQREAALRAGIDCIEWTYDPMRAKNAFFNIGRLGAIVRRYLPDHYGRVESRLQQGLPSDRLIAEWWLKSRRVERALADKPTRPARRKPAAVVPVPPAFSSLAETQPVEARKLQQEVSRQLRAHFAQGLAITGFVPDNDGGSYLLDPIRAAGLPRSGSV
jgi:predicted GNAT superfamily acetyltransferase